MDNKNNCMICGAEIEYFAEPKRMRCSICGEDFEANAACVSGHYVCDACHSSRANELILAACSNTDSRNPIEITQRLMRIPAVHMHGPEHHVMVGAALITAYKNCGGEIDLQTALAEMDRRGRQVPGGACGFWGCCGAAVSAGIFVSIVTGSTPLKKQEWRMSNLMTSKALKSIADAGGPRCCKRDSFLAVMTAAEFIGENFGIYMEMPKRIVCGFSPFNNECLRNECPFNAAYGR